MQLAFQFPEDKKYHDQTWDGKWGNWGYKSRQAALRLGLTNNWIAGVSVRGENVSVSPENWLTWEQLLQGFTQSEMVATLCGVKLSSEKLTGYQNDWYIGEDGIFVK